MMIRNFVSVLAFGVILYGCQAERATEITCADSQRFFEELRLCQYQTMSEGLLYASTQAKSSRMLYGWKAGRYCTADVVKKYPNISLTPAASNLLNHLEQVDFYRYISIFILHFNGQLSKDYIAEEESAYVMLEESERHFVRAMAEICKS